MKVKIWLLLICWSSILWANDPLDYQQPSKEILELVDVNLAPTTIIDEANKNIVLLYRNTYKSIDELSQQELRLAGLRIDPKTNIGSRVTYFNHVAIQRMSDNSIVEITGLPKNPKLTNFNWSVDQSLMAMTHTGKEGVELWLIDIENATAKRLTDLVLNANMGNLIEWMPDNQTMLVKALPKNKKQLIDTKSAVPSGPTVSVSDGKKAQNRTYQDLLKNKNDEHNFEVLAESEIKKVSIKGKVSDWIGVGMYGDISISPNGEYVLLTQYSKPFSYLVPYSRFPHTVTVYSHKAKKVSTIVEVPLLEDLPKGFMAVQKGRRSVNWRSDKPASLYYFEALDEGDPDKEMEFRDQLVELSLPFNGKGKSLMKTHNRLYSVTWANDELALVQDYWWNNRNTKAYLLNPSKVEGNHSIIFDRNYQDRYNDPGAFVTHRNAWGKNVLTLANNKLFLLGDGYSEKGQFPFLDTFDLSEKKSKRIYQSTFTDKLENLVRYDSKNNQLMVKIESKNEYPNYYVRNLNDQTITPISNYENPFKSIQNVEKQVITYKRDDGLELTATLYLPTDYEKGKQYPMILWAYPREFKDKSSASQNTQNPNEFVYPNYGSPIYWVTKGYVVLDDASFPIVGVGEEEPNDSFRKQLVANAAAAINAVDNMGLIDPKRVAVGGHSYGAFMVANLLSHSDLFAAGIARSGAYNRTLTPFGFQSEERSYWDAPEVYYTMSPFMHADKMKTPLLLIHGEDDNNSGTYPMQSERYFNALKGLGAPVRLVMLPKESHGYRAKESVLHVLWEQDQWLEKHLKTTD